MIDLSIVIAAYNEEKRLPITLDFLMDYLERMRVEYEIVVVDDGSSDKTASAVQEISVKNPAVRLIASSPNRGRGISIREGVLQSRGEMILETDADGSVAHEAIGRFYEYLHIHPEAGAVFGSRELLESVVVASQPFLRWLLGYGFLWLARIVFFSWKTTDFTLGFKMFRRRAAEDIFLHQFENQYVAEAEIVYVAKKRGWRVKELPVSWADNRDSRVRPIRDSFRSLKGVFLILARSVLGKYNGKTTV